MKMCLLAKRGLCFFNSDRTLLFFRRAFFRKIYILELSTKFLQKNHSQCVCRAAYVGQMDGEMNNRLFISSSICLLSCRTHRSPNIFIQILNLGPNMRFSHRAMRSVGVSIAGTPLAVS